MANRRLEIDAILKAVGVATHSTNFHLYYQPPASVKLIYPCIIYEMDSIESDKANNKPYNIFTRYSLTIISRDVDDPLVQAVAKLPMCTFDRHFVSENLYHDVFIIY